MRRRAELATDTPHGRALADYEVALRRAPLAASSCDKYLGRVHGYLTWLGDTAEAGGIEGEPLFDPTARDWAVRDFRRHLKNGRREPATINNYLAAIDDFYLRRGMGKANAAGEKVTRRTRPKSLPEPELRRYLRAVETAESLRDRVVALLPYYAGARIGEVVGLDRDDVMISARKGVLRLDGKGGKVRYVPIKTQLREPLLQLLETVPALDLPGGGPLIRNIRGDRLSDRSARAIVVGFGDMAGVTGDPVDPFGPHTLRHNFGYWVVRNYDIVVAAELLGHTSLETTRLYSLPTDQDMITAVEGLPVDE